MNLLETAVLLAICIWLLTKYVTDTDLVGPFGLFERFRSLVGITPIEIPSPNGSPIIAYQSNGRFFAEVFSCPYCAGPYIGVLVVCLFLIFGVFPWSWSVVILWLSGVGLATAFVRVTDG